MNNNDPYQRIRQQMSPVASGRRKRKSGRISGENVTPETEFFVEEATAFDVDSNAHVTVEYAEHHILACGCRASAPYQVGGVCIRCARAPWSWFRRKPRYVCRDHNLCIRCQRVEDRGSRGIVTLILAALLYPFFDVYDEQE